MRRASGQRKLVSHQWALEWIAKGWAGPWFGGYRTYRGAEERKEWGGGMRLDGKIKWLSL